MIIVDTNVWSETLRREPAPAVTAWLRKHHRDLYLSATSVFELRLGLLRMPEGHRRSTLERAVTRMLDELAPRVVSYDISAAMVHARLRHAAQRAGRALTSEDGQILATAWANEASIATRNVRDFDGFDVPVINPWTFSPED